MQILLHLLEPHVHVALLLVLLLLNAIRVRLAELNESCKLETKKEKAKRMSEGKAGSFSFEMYILDFFLDARHLTAHLLDSFSKALNR